MILIAKGETVAFDDGAHTLISVKQKQGHGWLNVNAKVGEQAVARQMYTIKWLDKNGKTQTRIFDPGVSKSVVVRCDNEPS